MVLLCFVADLRSLPPPLLRELKQSLLELANFYAISLSRSQSEQDCFLRDRIGLCYIFNNRVSSSDELKIAYCPGGNFNLPDFHYAVNNLSTEAFSPQLNDLGAPFPCDLMLSSILSDQVIYSWGGKDIAKKIIFLSSCLPKDVDSAMHMTLSDAAEKCVSLDFVFFEQNVSHLSNVQEDINNFVTFISDLDNCSCRTYLQDASVLHGLVKQWLLDLKDDMEEPLQACFSFKSSLTGSVSQISCNLCISINQIIDGFSHCQTCRCHDIPFNNNRVKNTVEGLSCPVTGHDLGTDANENSVKVGDKSVLFLPFSQGSMKLRQASSPIKFDVIERTNLGSLSEAVIIGASYIVTPSACQEMEAASDEIDQSELNSQIFQGLCNALHSLDEGLVCSSNCNLETMREAVFQCYYILQPSDNGPMLLRRLAGSEEVLPIPEVNRLFDSSVTKELENSVRASLLKMKSREYNPILHERGFHKKLNLVMEDNLQIGCRSIPPKLNEATSKPSPTRQEYSQVIVESNSAIDVVVLDELDLRAGEDKSSARITEEWEQLIVNEATACISKPKLDQLLLSPPPDSNKQQLDIQTLRILERLEVPRQLKANAVSPITTSSGIIDACNATEKHLNPLQPIHAVRRGSTPSLLMKPIHQRLKRKHS